MTPVFFTTLAGRLHPHRWWFMGLSIASFAALALTLTWGPPDSLHVVGALAGPAIVTPWGLLCACVWFHPEHGNLRPGSRWIGKAPRALQTITRWYAALFLTVFLAVGTLVWPLLVWHWG